MAALEGAAKYLNNLLLARGLLQHGKSLDFARANDDENGDTTSRIINLVHDLVLRRDRQTEHNEAMAATIRNLRLEDSQRVLDMQRLQDKNIQLQNKATTAESHERAMRMSLKKAETQAKELKDQTLKMKSMLDQVRAKCLGDVKERDKEIENLRAHIAGLQRGTRRANQGSAKQSTAIGKQRPVAQNDHGRSHVLEDESNELLAALVSETSTENVSLRRIMTDTMTVLKDLSGFEDVSDHNLPEDDGIGIPGQYRKSRHRVVGTAQSEALIPCETLAEEMTTILEHCRTILKDPSFVPIEEVQIREEEIVKLRAGWEKMADRWKEAVTMMAQWRQRMMQDGREVEVEELSDLSFGRSIAVRPDGQPVLGRDVELSVILEQSRIELDDLDDLDGPDHQSSGQADNDAVHYDKSMVEAEEEESDLELQPEPAQKRLASSPAKRGVRIPRLSQPLRETNGNISHKSNVSFESPLSQTSTLGLDGTIDIENDTFHYKSRSKIAKIGRHDSERGTIEDRQSPLSLAEKLAAIEAEAIQARREQQQEVSLKRKSSLRATNLRKANRRRSTLSPEELATLMRAG